MKTISIFLLLMSLTLITPAYAQNSVSIQLVRSGDGALVDIAYLGCHYQFQILIENDFVVGHMDFPFKIYSEDGTAWAWIARPNGYGSATHAVTVIPGCRMDPAEDVWDMTGLLVTEENVDGLITDTLIFGGVAMFGGLSTGPPEPMIALHFMPETAAGDAGSICMDSLSFVPPYHSFGIGASFVEFFAPPIQGPFCWPVARMQYILGDFDSDGQITVGDIVEMINVIFRGKIPLVPMEAGDVNCDGNTNVGDALYLINYIFKFGPSPDCP